MAELFVCARSRSRLIQITALSPAISSKERHERRNRWKAVILINDNMNSITWFYKKIYTKWIALFAIQHKRPQALGQADALRSLFYDILLFRSDVLQKIWVWDLQSGKSCINLKKEAFLPRSSAPHSARIAFFSLIFDWFMKSTNFQKWNKKHKRPQRSPGECRATGRTVSILSLPLGLRPRFPIRL